MQHQQDSTQRGSTEQSERRNQGLITEISESVHVENLFTTTLSSKTGSPIYSSEFLTEDMFLGLGCGDGSIRIMSATKGDFQYVLRNQDHSPVSCLSLNPNHSNIKNAIMATHSDGTLEYWHATSQQLLFSKNYEEFLHCCQISTDGANYVFAGDKGRLLMGALSKGNPTDLETGHIGSHDNRVYCLKWNPFDNHTFYSGSWDKTVFGWDTRSKTAVFKVYGLYMGGMAIDVNQEQELLLGNNTNEMPLRIYDLRTDKVRLIDWKCYSEEESHLSTGVLACGYGKEKGEVLAVSPHQDLRLFRQGQCISRVNQNENKDKKIFALSISEQSRVCALGWNTGEIELLHY